jgi:hypothetical protein
MKTYLKLLLVFTIVSVIKVSGQGIIIDHNCTDISQIPTDVINDVKSNVKLHYCGQSHSEQITCGLEEIETSLYNVAIGDAYLPNVSDALNIYWGLCGYLYIGPMYYEDLDYVGCTLSDFPAINVSQWEWCDDLDTYSQSQVNQYLNAINTLESLYPDVTFVYTTGNAQVNGADGYNRYLRNNQIRQYCIDNNKVLYDFADLDCWYNGQQATYTYNSQQIPIQHSAYNGNDCGHANTLSTTIKAKAEWWMMARISGWQATSAQSLSIKVFLQGNYTDSGMGTNLNLQGLLPLNQPFNTPPLNYYGNESVQAIPDTSIVEWVLVELRDAATAQTATSNTMILQKAAFILNNGLVVDLDGSSNIQFEQTINQQLFVVIRHRNHLGIMSSFPLIANNNIYQYDFTTSNGQAFGGSNSQIELSSGVCGMISGDGNLDGVIDNIDKTLTWTTNSGDAGYYSGDFTLNGNVNNQDKNLIWISNFGKISYIP